MYGESIFAYTYDNADNILTVNGHTYTYGDSDWGDLLTAYDGVPITHDEIGNPLNDGTWEYTWEHGRELATMSSGSTTWSYTYNADGLRTKRTNGSTTYNYIYNGSSLSQMTVGNNTLYFAYDASGTPMSVTYNGTNYYYATNVQGDVTAILNTSGTAVVQYTYDAWGSPLSVTGTMAETLGVVNPLRYRGYVFDSETQFYYLQSRYYDPELGRFINADSYVSTGQGVLGNNMFAYCGNNPIINADMEGTFFFTVLGAVVGATVGAVDAWLMGGDWEDIKRGAKAGAYSGAIAGAGVDTAIIVVASGGSMGVALGIVAGSGALSGVVGTGISTDWQADTVDYFGAAMLGAGLNMISFGTAPINGEIIRGTIPQMIDDVFLVSSGTGMNLLGNVASTTIIAEASIWIYRVITEKELVEYE